MRNFPSAAGLRCLRRHRRLPVGSCCGSSCSACSSAPSAPAPPPAASWTWSTGTSCTVRAPMADHEYTQILYDVEDHVATITLNRPDKLNAFTGTMMYEMIDAFDRIDADDDVRAVIVTGAGRGFCAGADLSGGGDDVRRRRQRRAHRRRRRATRRRWAADAADLRVHQAGHRRGQRSRGRRRA